MSEPDSQELRDIVQAIVGRLHISAEVSVGATPTNTGLTVAIQAPEEGRLLIGKNGQNIKALEHVIRLVWARRYPEATGVIVDVNDYRKERITELTTKIHEVALRVKSTGQSEALPPMSAYERRIVHTELAAYHDVVTESIGEDPQRRVVIKLA
jgi:spoIIIJ-associated protein